MKPFQAKLELQNFSEANAKERRQFISWMRAKATELEETEQHFYVGKANFKFPTPNT